MASDEDAARRSNRDLQRVYRERHGEDLRKARRVANALMGLRRKSYAQGVKNTAGVKILLWRLPNLPPRKK